MLLGETGAWAQIQAHRLPGKKTQEKTSRSLEVLDLEFYQVSYQAALREIANAFRAGLILNAGLMPKGKVSKTLKTVTLQQALDLLFQDTEVVGNLSNNGTIMLEKRDDPQEIMRGSVTDESGNALPGVNVLVKGSSQGTVTDIDGKYSLDIPDNTEALVFSFVGYQTLEVAIDEQATIDVQLSEDAQSLEEVVITALNIEKNAKSLGYTVAQLDGDKVSTVQTPNIISALSGKVAGVDVSNIANGVAGSKRIVIRGAASLTGNNQPLWVIDGIPINSSSLGGPDAYGGVDYGDGLTMVNPDDVENISVLKGNAAAALYGSQASNGVIIVTTKSGKDSDGKMNVDISSSLLLDEIINTTDFQYVYGQSSRVEEDLRWSNLAGHSVKRVLG